MANTQLFTTALGLSEPWFAKNILFDAEKHRLDREIDFHVGAKFKCPSCKRAGSSVHDTQKHT